MIMIKRTEHNLGVIRLEYLCYANDQLIHQEVVEDILRYQVLDVLAPDGEDILIKERVYYSDDEYQETEKIVKYQVGNIHKNSIDDISPVTIEESGIYLRIGYVDRLTTDSARIHVIRKSIDGYSIIDSTSNKTFEKNREDKYEVIAWASTAYGDSAMAMVSMDPFSTEVFYNENDIPSTAIAGEDLILPHTFNPTSTCKVFSSVGHPLLELTPVGGTVTIPGSIIKSGNRLTIRIVRPGSTDINRLVTVVDDYTLEGEIPRGHTSITKMINELKVLEHGDSHPLDSEFHRSTPAEVDPLNMTKLRLDGYETFDDYIYSVDDEALHRFTGENMISKPLDVFTDHRLPEDTRFITRRADDRYFVATSDTIGIYSSLLVPTVTMPAVIRYMTGGYFFGLDTIYYIKAEEIVAVPLPSELRTYIPTFTQYGFIHFMATNQTPADLPKHNAIDLKTMTLLPLGAADGSVSSLDNKIVTHTCTSIDGEPLIIANNVIYRYDIVTKKYIRLLTVPGMVEALYKLDNFIIIKTGDSRHYKLVMPT